MLSTCVHSSPRGRRRTPRKGVADDQGQSRAAVQAVPALPGLRRRRRRQAGPGRPVHRVRLRRRQVHPLQSRGIRRGHPDLGRVADLRPPGRGPVQVWRGARAGPGRPGPDRVERPAEGPGEARRDSQGEGVQNPRGRAPGRRGLSLGRWQARQARPPLPLPRGQRPGGRVRRPLRAAGRRGRGTGAGEDVPAVQPARRRLDDEGPARPLAALPAAGGPGAAHRHPRDRGRGREVRRRVLAARRPGDDLGPRGRARRN